MKPEFPFTGDERLAAPVARALHRVVDPELAIDIVALGLVYGVEAADGEIDVRITMTSAACPVTEHIAAEIEAELVRELGEAVRIHVLVVWEPPWGPERLTERARRALEWD